MLCKMKPEINTENFLDLNWESLNALKSPIAQLMGGGGGDNELVVRLM